MSTAATARLGSSCSERVSGANQNIRGVLGQNKVGQKFSMNSLGAETMSAKGEITLMNDGTT